MPLVTELASQVGSARACAELGVARSSYYRFRTPKTAASKQPKRRPPPRALTQEEREVVRAELNSERFADATPRTI
jgi:putative transposase